MLIIKPYYGRLGNKILQLLNILCESLAQKQQIKLDGLNYIIPIYPLINLKNIEKMSRELFPESKNDIVDTFFPKNVHLANKRTVDLNLFFKVAQQFIIPNINIPLKICDDRICYIHIRNGDIFNNNPHKAYVQPPLNYYIKIINENNDKFDKFIIVTQISKEKCFNFNYNNVFKSNKNNPCINELLKYSNKISLIQGNLYEHYALLMSAKSLILSKSSFSDTAVFMNKNLKNLYYWNWNSYFADKTVIPDNINIFSYKLTKPYINEWKCTDSQLKLMVDYDISDIVLE